MPPGSQTLAHRLDLPFNLGQRGLQGGTPGRIRGPLRKNILSLQVERLSLALNLGMTLLGQPSRVFTYKAGAGVNLQDYYVGGRMAGGNCPDSRCALP